jgi:hypothetical protein
MTPNERPRDYESFQVRIVHQLGAAKAHGFSPATLLASAEKVIEQSRLRCLLLAQLGHAGAVVSCLLLGAEQTTSARREYFAF